MKHKLKQINKTDKKILTDIFMSPLFSSQQTIFFFISIIFFGDQARARLACIIPNNLMLVILCLFLYVFRIAQCNKNLYLKAITLLELTICLSYTNYFSKPEPKCAYKRYVYKKKNM